MSKVKDYQIIGVDISKDNTDYSAVSYRCPNCNTIISVKLYNPEVNQVGFSLYSKCPYCGKKAKKYKIMTQ